MPKYSAVNVFAQASARARSARRGVDDGVGESAAICIHLAAERCVPRCRLKLTAIREAVIADGSLWMAHDFE